MNNSSIIGLFIIVAVGGFVWWQNSAEETTVVPETTVENTTPVSTAETSMSGDDTRGELEDDESDDVEDDDSSTGTGQAVTPTPTSAGVTASVVAEHSTRASCWTIINGNVYDLTSWIPKHPGGEQAILQLCGTDGSAKFNRKHGGDSSKEKILFGFKVAALSQ